MARLRQDQTYLTPDEAREQGVEWAAREGEPEDLTDPFHYQTPAEAEALGRDWATQQAGIGGRDPMAGPESQVSRRKPGGFGRGNLPGAGEIFPYDPRQDSSPVDLDAIVQMILDEQLGDNE